MFLEVNGSTLGVFRLLFGLLLMDDFHHLHEYFRLSLVETKFLIPYEGFEWLGLLPRELISPFFYFMMVASLMFALGIYRKFNNLLLLLGFGYIFLVDVGHYNNHYYFYVLVLFLMLFVNTSWGGIQHGVKPLKVPYYQLVILQLQVFIVYFFGGLAKFEPDWLNGVPMIFWTWSMSENFPLFLQEIYRMPETAIVLSYIGLLFDLLVGFALFTRRFKRPALIFILLFHLQNSIYFTIGTFPYMMIAGTILFAHPDYGERIYAAFRDGWYFSLKQFLKNKPLRAAWNWFRTKSPKMIGNEGSTFFPKPRKFVTWTLGVYFVLQVLLPFRMFLFEGKASWTGEGHLFAWRMMLVDTVEGVRYWIEDEETGERYPVAIDEYISFRQFYKMSRTPRNFLSLAHFIRDEAKANGVENPIIRMEVYKSVNERPPLLLNDTTLNYATVEYRYFKHADWMLDWDHKDQEIVFDQNKYNKWKEILETQQSSNY